MHTRAGSTERKKDAGFPFFPLLGRAPPSASSHIPGQGLSPLLGGGDGQSRGSDGRRRRALRVDVIVFR